MGVVFWLVLCLGGLAVELGSIILLGRSVTGPWEEGPVVLSEARQPASDRRAPLSRPVEPAVPR